MRHRLSTPLLSSIVLVALAVHGHACPVEIIPTPCEALANADAVFIARITAITPLTDVDSDDAAEAAERIAHPGVVAFMGPYRIDVVVERAFFGVPVGPLSVRSEVARSMPLIPSARWLFYGRRDSDSGALVVLGPGSRSAPVQHAADDIAFLSSRVPLTTRLAGLVTHWEFVPGVGVRRVAPLADVRVTITDAGGSAFDVFTDRDGLYEVRGLPAGAYMVHADIPEPLAMAIEDGMSIDVPLRGCATLDIVGWPTGRVTGRITDASGRGVEGMVLGLDLADRHSSHSDAMAEVVTDEEGRYEFERVPDGDYVVVVNPVDDLSDDTSAFFVPGVASKTDAAIAHVDAGGSVDDFDIRLARDVTMLEGIVLDAAGTPVPFAWVALTPADNSEGTVVPEALTDADGRFTLRVFEETVGTLQAHAYTVIDREGVEETSNIVAIDLRDGAVRRLAITFPPR